MSSRIMPSATGSEEFQTLAATQCTRSFCTAGRVDQSGVDTIASFSVAPHVARAIVGADYRWVLPASAGAGAVLLVASDVVGRVLVRPAELQVGIVVALVGAPFFVALVRRRTLAAL